MMALVRVFLHRLLPAVCYAGLVFAPALPAGQSDVAAVAEPRQAAAQASGQTGGESAEPAVESAVDPRADRVLREMGDYLKHARAFTFRVDEVSDEVLEGDTKVQYGMRNEIAVRRPDRLRANSEGDLGSERFWYDGEEVVVMDYDFMAYRRAPVPATIDLALDYAAENLDLVAPLADLVYSDPYQVLIANVESGHYLGHHQVRGRSAHHLLFIQQEIDWQVWVADDWVPVPLKVVITYKTEPHSPQFIAWLSHWEFAPYLPDSLFEFNPPSEAVEKSFGDGEQ